MPDQLEFLKYENNAAANDFQNAVKNYLLNPLESAEERQRALSYLFESVTKYRTVLRAMREYLHSMDEAESVTKQETIEQAIAAINIRDAALERLLKRVGRLAADQAARSMAAPGGR
ncbi:MAG TPA: hypothetical protein VKN18_22045 [Blastocatellia bacterium]|nr:hypothetical protein [Blastocatellia bacterium]